ncbi:MAG: cytochrome ubiquinol oxidase subunit I [Candidatus Electryonea clarkiae]|nr:cytochrome ubiquinol oxidase subunit I [Candidatus Electryonea clarkiae]MDP8287370.1 cytochrome ubiquinol oxidase subunit I [Candidatus Electryonea clarkiae]
MDPVLLARIQFALTIGFHFIFPPITIGLAWLLVILEWKGWKGNNEDYARLGKFFSRIFALTFAIGVATGIVMEFQFGTNWARYSTFVGDIFGAPLAAEGIFAFFLESSFLGLYLFGRGRLSKGVHWFSSLMLAFGATLSAFWIIVANSWQQTPAGYVYNEIAGRAELTSFFEAVFNPSTMIRYLHTVDAALITGAFFMAGISAYMILKNKDVAFMRKSLVVSLVFGFVASILEVMPFGHEHARQVAHTQPEKFAAIEGLYKTQSSAPLVLFAIPGNDPEPRLDAEISIPSLLSWMVFGDPHAEVRGIDHFPKDEIPPLWLTFVSFHNMVVLGMFFIGVTALGLFLYWRRKLFESKWFLKLLVISIPLPVAACEFGWVATEVGRQPWVVYKLLRTSDAISVTVPAGNILFSIIVFTLIYLLLFALWVFLLIRKVNHGVPVLEEKEVTV